ncbi:hypothetical protein F5Y16DRAFT_415455 [Xylariaceae sp. FL0255]|nr:hypothetical protein F5Y16DRAFT_415455 [Xylariaceae sp. FL0255]
MSATNQTGQRKTVEDYFLVRSVYHQPRTMAQVFQNIIDPNSQPDWHAFVIRHPPVAPGLLGDIVCQYAINPIHHAYVTFNIRLTYDEDHGSTRVTDMRHRDMIVDNFLAAGGDLKKLKWIGAHNVINTPARTAISNVFHELNADIGIPGHVVLDASHPLFGELTEYNACTQGIVRLCAEYSEETGRAQVKRFIFITQGWQEKHFVGNMTVYNYEEMVEQGYGWEIESRPDTVWTYRNPTLHILAELHRPDDESSETSDTAGTDESENKAEDNPEDNSQEHGQGEHGQGDQGQGEQGQGEKKKKKRNKKNKNKNK